MLAMSVTHPVLAVPQPPATVSVIQIKKVELSESLLYPARVVPKVNSVILAETDGVISKIQSPLGQSVSSGARILTISHTDPVYQFAPFRVNSPISGVVSSLEVTEGTQVSKGQRLGAVTDPKKVRFNIEIPASDLAYVSRGMKGVFQIAGRDEVVPVVIRGVSPFVDPATGTASGELEPDGKSALVSPGLVGQVSFKANLHQGFSIPEHAIIYKGDATFVRLVKDGKTLLTPVKLGRRQRGTFEITGGLEVGMSVIERASRYIADGDAVQVSTGS
ncbi:MAG: HlyD family efflux transporter periplasmic adaptor subunit [Methylotenera sp.]|nr:HlyD family efflux transporter periplasmic adaptor subunit [Oligoflexia bacterium]